ncbi:MAG: outer membrane beta-barrel protein [Methylorubrum populi]
MSRERPNGDRREGRRGAGPLALALLPALLGAPALAQDGNAGQNDTGQNDTSWSDPGRSAAPTAGGRSRSVFDAPTGLRGAGAFAAPSPLGASPAPGAAASEEAEEGVSRLPRFRAAPSLPGSAAARGTPARPSVLRLRAAPPRRFGSPTRAITQRRTQETVTDLRLTPVIQTPVSGVPLPTPILGLGLPNAAGFLLGTALRRPLPPDTAYAPLGIQLGTFTLLSAFTQSVGYDSNPDQIGSTRLRPSLTLRSEAELALRSAWSASEFTAEMSGSYLEYPQNPEASRPNAVGTSRLRIDIDRDTRFELETRFLLDSQRLGSPDLGTAATTRPIFATYGATAGVQESFNRLQLSLRGSIDRSTFEDAQLGDGTLIRQSDRDANQYGLRLRAGYEISPTITPFVETFLDTRIYDSPVDQFGLRRDSDGIAFTAGATVQLNGALTAEVSGGLQHRSYVDRTLQDIDAPLINAALIWSVSPLTTVRFNQQTGVVETAVPGSSGAFTDAATLEVQHDLLRNLSITLGGAYLSNTYDGVNIRERGFSATARFDYRFNRWLALRGSYIYSTLTSTLPLSSYEAHTVLLGVRVNP